MAAPVSFPTTRGATHAPDHFTLTRQSDGKACAFAAEGTRFGCISYRFAGGDLAIHWHPRWGWCAADSAGEVVGLPMSVPKPEQRNRPPEGLWVSRKGQVSHVYELRWGQGVVAAAA